MTDVATEAAPGTGRGDLDASTYEVLRGRLHERAAELARRAEALNARRLSTFGSAELRLVGTDRVRTEHNCVPRDIMSVGGLMLFGYNVFIGLKPETQVRDVFSLHRFLREGEAFRFDDVDPAALPGLLTDPGFERDFAELYRYYREARLLQLLRLDDRLLAVFQIGPRTEDVRVLRWRLDRDSVSYLDSRGERDHVFPPSHGCSPLAGSTTSTEERRRRAGSPSGWLARWDRSPMLLDERTSAREFGRFRFSVRGPARRAPAAAPHVAAGRAASDLVRL